MVAELDHSRDYGDGGSDSDGCGCGETDTEVVAAAAVGAAVAVDFVAGCSDDGYNCVASVAIVV